MGKNRGGGSPAVKDGKLVSLSVSSIEKFDDTSRFGCQRKWWFRYVKRLPEPQAAAAERGQDCHERIENYITSGVNGLGKDELRMIQYIKPYVQLAGVEVEVELTKDKLKACGIPFIGYIDLLNKSGWYVNPRGEWKKEPFTKVVEVNDWKFTGSIAQNAKTPTGLKESVQMLGYAMHEVAVDPALEVIRLSHTYGSFKNEDAEKVSTVIEPVKVVEAWKGHVEPFVEQMMKAAAVTDPAQLPPPADLSKCQRCPYLEQCPSRSEDPLAFLVPEATAVPQGVTVSLFDKFPSSSSPASSSGSQSTQPTPTVNPPAPQTTTTTTAGHPSILPPDAPPSNPAKAADPVPDAPPAVVAANPAVYAAPAAPAAGTASAVVSDAPVVQEPTPAQGKKRGRPSKAELEARKATEAAGQGGGTLPTTPAAKMQFVQEHIQGKGAVAAEEEHPREMLFLNCRPDYDGCPNLEDYVLSKAKQLAERFKVVDIRCVPKDNPMAYGGWRGALAGLIRQEPPSYTEGWLRTGSDFADVAAEALAPLFHTVTRGI